MLAVERKNRILSILQEEKKVVVGELAELFDVSEETIRRDLEKLESEGLVVKAYGGAVLNENLQSDMPLAAFQPTPRTPSCTALRLWATRWPAPCLALPSGYSCLTDGKKKYYT